MGARPCGLPVPAGRTRHTFDVQRPLKATSYARRALAAMLDEIPSQAKLNTEKKISLDSFLRGRMDL